MSSPWMDATASASERAASLLAAMTIGEKCHQLTGVMPWTLIRPDGSDPVDLESILVQPPGHVAQLIRETPQQLADTVGAIQRTLVERTRLGVPALFHAEALNGILAGGHMIFPTAIGLAATWEPRLVEEMADLTRTQMLRVGLRHALSPVMDVALDPRWGRVHETFGEDPYLVAAFSVAYTRGLQGTDPAAGVIATGKHFLGYAFPESGMNAATVNVGRRRLRDVFAFPFEAAIRQAGLGSIMNSYSDIDGVPVAASREILTDLLRRDLGFDGFVSADYASIEQLATRQGVAHSLGEAGRLALTAGLDVEFPQPVAYGDRLVEEVAAGRLDIAVVDEALRRVLVAKFSSGLFENPFPEETIDVAAVAAEGSALSLETARRSVVLLENDGLLPAEVAGTRVAIVGPHADAPELQFATYTYPNWRAAVDAIHLGSEMTMVGVDNAADDWHHQLIAPGEAAHLPTSRYGTRSIGDVLAEVGAEVSTHPGSGLTTRLGDDALDDAALGASGADLVIAAVGGASLWFSGERTEGEASDTADLALPAPQVELLERIAATGTPFIVVLVQGRPYILPPVVRRARAVMVSTYAGPFGLQAVAEVITGRIEPRGRLPYSIPRHGGQVPVYHHRPVGSGGRSATAEYTSNRYLDLEADAEYPFGAGSGWSTFELSDLAVPDTVSTTGGFPVAVTVHNTGSRAASTVVQLYLRQRTSGLTHPWQKLGGFQHVHLEAGGASRVTFDCHSDQLAASDLDHRVTVRSGHLEVVVAFDSAGEGLHAQMPIDGHARIVEGADRVFFSNASTL